MKYAFIFLVLTGLVISPYLVSDVSALCVINDDWPDEPCFSGRRGMDPSLNQMKQGWAPYYEFKGAEWMESQKQELLQTIQNGNLLEWIKGDPNGARHNVYMYYFLMGDIPNQDGLFAEEYYGVRLLSPLRQSDSGIAFDEIHCGIDLILIQKYDGSPACVTESTKQKLIERGWITTKDDSDVFDSIPAFDYEIKTSAGITHGSQYFISGALVDEISYDEDRNSLTVLMTSSQSGILQIVIPIGLLHLPTQIPSYVVIADGEEIEYEKLTPILLKIPFDSGTEELEIIGTLP
ncbi:MAG: hypothetical protein K5798_03685 [Nitrosopumilus sp.]|uniref:hypothetical protein n=1 Tax=Nitrosopumilus sp. TaxID=2024843 RepID=UPI00243207A5|nr:hypothetical protein [Nitrosopumilus sp.]MCV0366354.1 hypothetical protein [Nitrosopumilus sp.]